MHTTRLAIFVLLIAATSGCATQAVLTVRSQPEGAFITEEGTGRAYGMAPVNVAYDAGALSQHRAPDGCFLVKGFEARWVSGTSSSLEQIRLCGSKIGAYSILFSRGSRQPGLEKDLQFAIQLQALRAQQQQAQAAQDAAAAALYSSWATPPSQNVLCISNQVGNTVITNCR